MAAAAIDIAVVGAGPAGLTLALLAAERLADARITVYDARPIERDVTGDARTLALSLGSVQLLERLRVWPAGAAQPIQMVHVSQAPPSWDGGRAAVSIDAAEQGVAMLGAVLSYGALVAPLQAAWLDRVAADPGRLSCRFGAPVQGIKPLAAGAEVQAGSGATAVDAAAYDLVVVAEGGVFADQARKAITHDYRQTAWVGRVLLEGAQPGTAFERFTRQGPLALLPLPPLPPLPPPPSHPSAEGASAAQRWAALVWCVNADDDPVQTLDAGQRKHVMQALLPDEAGRIVEVSPLKAFPLGLNAERTLVQGRRVSIGNAAQTLHPVAGQGLNLGLRDAHELVDTLRFGAGVDAALRRVEWSRAPDRWATIASTDFLARSFALRWLGLGTLRGLGLAALQGLPPLKRALARQMMFGSR